MTNHHPDCQNYNDSLIDVWRVSIVGAITASGFFTDNEGDAEAMYDAERKENDGDDAIIMEKTKMHRELFESLPEFDGF